MTGFLRNIDCLVLEVYKYTRIHFSFLRFNSNGIACICLGEIWFDNNQEGKWAFM